MNTNPGDKKTPEKKKVQTAFRFEVDLLEALDREASKQERSRNNFLAYFLRKHLIDG